MLTVPSNSNIALLVHAINGCQDSEAMEFFIMTGIIHYCEEILSIDLSQFDIESVDYTTARNMQDLAQDLFERIQRKHPNELNT